MRLSVTAVPTGLSLLAPPATGHRLGILFHPRTPQDSVSSGHEWGPFLVRISHGGFVPQRLGVVLSTGTGFQEKDVSFPRSWGQNGACRRWSGWGSGLRAPKPGRSVRGRGVQGTGRGQGFEDGGELSTADRVPRPRLRLEDATSGASPLYSGPWAVWERAT